MWSDHGLYISDNGEVVDFIYEDKSGPRSGNITEAVVVQFCELYDDIEHFVSEIPQTDSTLIVYA